MPTQASTAFERAASNRQSLYQHAESSAQVFIDNAGQFFTIPEAVTLLDDQLSADLGARTLVRIVAHLVEDRADPVSMVNTTDGVSVGVGSYSEEDFYYEAERFHDTIGVQTVAVCARCVDNAEFDHQASTFPDWDHYLKQRSSNMAAEGMGSVGKSVTKQQRREVLGLHYIEEHTNLTTMEVIESYQDKDSHDVADDLGLPNPEISSREWVNDALNIHDAMVFYGISFDDVKEAHNLGLDSITVGATLVSGTTVGGNTVIHGGNQIDFNVEAFGTASTTSGEVPTAQGDGTLAMQSPSGGSSAWTLDGTFSPGSTSDATYTMSSNYPIIEIRVTDDSSATANNEIDLRVNGNSSATYHTSQGGDTPSADSFAKEIFHTTYAGGMKILMAGQWSGNWSGKTMGGENPNHGVTAHEMASTGLTSPLDSFTIFDDAANNYNITADVYGYTG